MPAPIERKNRDGSSSWQVKYRRKLPGGGVTRKFATYDTEKEAQDAIDILDGKVAAKEKIEDMSREASTSLDMLLDRYTTEVVEKLPKKAKDQRASLVRKFRRLEWSDYPLLNLDRSLINEWREEMVEQGLSGSTISGAMNTLSGVFTRAISDWNYRIINPVSGAKRVRPNDPREAHLRAREEDILLAACEQGPLYLIWATHIALKTAMRASEIRRMERRHIHLDRGFIHLPKTKNGEKRDVPLVMPGAVEVIAEAMESLPVRPDGYLFGDPEKLAAEGGFTSDMLTNAFSDAVDRAAEADAEFKQRNANPDQGADLTFHDLRHVATTRLKPLHRDALDLSKTTGHKTLGVLARYYNESIEDRVERLTQIVQDHIETQQRWAERKKAASESATESATKPRAKGKPKLAVVK